MEQKRRGGVRLRPRAESGLSREKILLRRAAGALLGAVFALSSLGETAPFGIAYLSAAAHPVFAAAGAFLVYAARGGRTGLSSAAAVTVMLTCRLVLDGTEAARKKGFYPLCAAVAALCTLGVASSSLREGLLTLCASALCAGFSLLLRRAKEGWAWGRLTALLGLLPAFLPLRVWGFSPGMAGAALTVLCAAASAGIAPGAAAGAVFGACADLALGQAPFTALTLCLGGMACGAVREKGVRPCALSFAAACGLSCLWLNKGVLFGETLAAAAAFTLLPAALRERVCAAFSGLARPGSGEKGVVLSDLRRAVSRLRESLSADLPADPGDLSTVYRAACETACRSCRRLSHCWRQDNDMRAMLSDAASVLRARHGLTPDDLPGWFRESCLRTELFCGAVNDAYRESLRRRARQKREASLQDVLTAQYSSMETLLGVALRRGAADPALEERVSQVVRAYFPRARSRVLTEGGRVRIHLLFDASSPPDDDPRPMLRSLEGALGVSLLPPRQVPAAKGSACVMTQRRLLDADLYVCAAAKHGQAVCGDSVLHRITDDGRLILLLSDGMGTGKAASDASRRALELIAGFARSGCSLADGTAAVLPVLAARFPQWGFVTLDLAEIDLFTGRTTFLKYGAAPGLLLRDGRTTRLAVRTLPAGLEPSDARPKPITLRLRAGDRLLLLSDGAWELPDPEGFLREKGGLRPQALAEEWIRRAAEKGGEDDMTVLAVALHSAEEQEAVW